MSELDCLWLAIIILASAVLWTLVGLKDALERIEELEK
jgi:hypothetical protein